MYFKEWEPIYHDIVRDFNFARDKDEEAAGILNNILENKNLFSLNNLRKLIEDNEIIIIGAGPSLEDSLHVCINEGKDKVKIVADGATSALLKHNILPDIIVTDLDGNIIDQKKACSEGSIIVIHAHGDNIDQIKRNVLQFNGFIIGTTQVDPGFYENLHNFGGFTDGDRAVFLAHHFHAKEICLIGFDFNTEIGEYSHAENKDKVKKIKKLQWCEYLIGMLKYNIKHINIKS